MVVDEKERRIKKQQEKKEVSTITNTLERYFVKDNANYR
jgi:hypothetical protein